VSKAKVLIYKGARNSVFCKIGPTKDNSKFFVTKKTRYNAGADSSDYPLIVSVSDLYGFLEANKIHDTEVEIDPGSIDVFYGFDCGDREKFAAIPNKGFVDRWWNRDCPNLYRHAVNKDKSRNWIGMYLVYWSNLLVEASYYGVFIDEDITEEEVAIFSRGREHTLVYKEMMNILNARKITAKQAAEMETWIRDYEQKIQRVIDDNKLAIMMSISHCFGPDNREKDYGLDCGFLMIYTRNEEYNRKKGLLKNLDKSKYSNSMSLRLPYDTQSLTIKRIEFDAIREIVRAETGEDLYCKTMLD